MQKTNRISVFVLVLISFFCFGVEAVDEDSEFLSKIVNAVKGIKKENHLLQNHVAQLENENKAFESDVKKKDKMIEKLKSEIETLKKTAGKTSQQLEAERKKFEEEKRALKKEKKELEEEKKRLAAQNGKNKKEAGEAKDEIREKDFEIETLRGEKQQLQSDLSIAQDTITDLETENKTLKEKTAYCSTPNPLMMIFQILTLICSICAIVLLIRNALAIKEFSENNWRN